MLKKIKLALSLIDSKSRKLVKIFALLRVLISILDVIGILLIGLLISKSAEQITGNMSSLPLVGWLDYSEFIALPTLAIASLFIFLGKSSLAVLFMKLMADTLAKAEASLAKKTFENFFLIDRVTLSKIAKSEISFALTFSASYAITNLLTMAIIVVSELALLTAVVVLFTIVNFKISLLIFAYFLIVGFAIHKVLGTRMQSAGKMYADSATNSTEVTEDSVNAIREILTLDKKDEFIEKFGFNRFGLAKSSANITYYSSLPRYIIESALMVGAIALAGYIFTVGNVSTAAGLLGIFLTGGLRMTASIIPLQSALAAIKQFSAQADPFFQLSEKSSFANQESKRPWKSFKNEKTPVAVEVRNVSYTYPNSNTPVLRDISLVIQPGEYIAIIGPSGAGKSTLADLIMGLTEPSVGQVNLANVNKDLASLGYVPQTPGIVHGSILDNVTLNVNSHQFDIERLADSLDLAHLTELIDSLNEGVHTNLGAHADSLSGGQMQRIGLARALYAQPGLLVLDEATSALDPETESAFSETLKKLRGKCSIIVIAHRLSTVKNADCVYVLDQGQIIASGKFNELAKSNELVAKYIELSHLNLD